MYKESDKRRKQKAEYKLRKRAECKIKLLAYLLDHPCVDCSISDPFVLTFDHVRGKKEYAVARMINDCYPWEKILAEIQKCEVRCMNCHWKRTSQVGNFWKQIEMSKLLSSGQVGKASRSERENS